MPLENEFDEDDLRSHHWILYTSHASTVGINAAGHVSNVIFDISTGITAEQNLSTIPPANAVPAGTVRLVPPPHPPHHVVPSTLHIASSAALAAHADAPEAACANAQNAQTQKAMHAPPATNSQNPNKPHHVPGIGPLDPEEPYIKLGRLAIVKPCRGSGLGPLLVETAIAWALENPQQMADMETLYVHIFTSLTAYRLNHFADLRSSGDIHPADDHVDVSTRGRTSASPRPWNGLILTHAQRPLEQYYNRLGFVRDEIMGVWDEEGIDHIGMWRRVDVSEPVRRS